MTGNTGIWKWQIPRQATFVLAMPPGAEVIHVAAIGGEGFMWARVDPRTERRVERTFHRRLTGASQPISASARHVGTYIESDGFVGHIFEGD